MRSDQALPAKGCFSIRPLSLYNRNAMPILRQALLDTYLVRLRAIARFWDIPLTTSRQRDVALELNEMMADGQAIERAHARLSDDQRRALQALLAADGQMPRRIFAREWGEIRAMGPGRMERDHPWEDPISTAEALWYRGFIFLSFEQGPEGAYEAVSVPPEMRKHLPAPQDSQRSVALEPIVAPHFVSSSGDLLMDDACTLLAYVQNERPQIDQDHRWSEKHRQRLLPRLRVRDRERFSFLRHLIFRIGWVVTDERARSRPEPEAVTSWLRSDSYPQRADMAEVWRDDPTWNDLFHMHSLQPEDTGAWRNDPTLARQAILHHLKACKPTRWYALDAFVAAVKRVDPDFQRPTGDYDTWYIRDQETGAYLSGFESWDAVEGRLVRYLITKPMAWLGLVDLGSDESEQAPNAFRLSRHGAAFLDLTDPPSPSPAPPPRLRPGFRVSIPADHRYERFQLARVAEWMETGDRFAYRMTPTSLERARQQDISIARVLEFLQEITEAPLPRSVEEALRRWDAHGTEASLEYAVLLRLSDAEMMDRIISSPRLTRLIKERIGPTAALVRQQDWPQLVIRLGEMGVLPQVPDSSG